MSVCYYATFYRKATDPQHEANVAAAEALVAAGVYKLPPKLAEYFGTEYAEEASGDMVLAVGNVSFGNGTYVDASLDDCVSELNDEYNIAEIDLDKLPEGVRRIVIRCSY